MKKLFCVLIIFLLSGCATMTPFSTQSINPGDEKNAGIGDVFFEFSEGQTMHDPLLAALGGTVSNGMRFELTILEMNSEKIGLQYNEFFYQPPKAIGYTMIPGGWMVKEGYNKRFDYILADKVIRFKGYEFEIVSVENGQIKYRRVK